MPYATFEDYQSSKNFLGSVGLINLIDNECHVTSIFTKQIKLFQERSAGRRRVLMRDERSSVHIPNPQKYSIIIFWHKMVKVKTIEKYNARIKNKKYLAIVQFFNLSIPSKSFALSFLGRRGTCQKDMQRLSIEHEREKEIGSIGKQIIFDDFDNEAR